MVNQEQSATSPGASNKVSDTAVSDCVLGIMTWTPYRDRALVALSILAMCALAWAYLIYLVSEMPRMASATAVTSMAMPSGHIWELLDFTAMMLPSASPMVLLYERINRKRESQGKTRNPVAGILMIGWGGWLIVLSALGS